MRTVGECDSRVRAHSRGNLFKLEVNARSRCNIYAASAFNIPFLGEGNESIRPVCPRTSATALRECWGCLVEAMRFHISHRFIQEERRKYFYSARLVPISFSLPLCPPASFDLFYISAQIFVCPVRVRMSAAASMRAPSRSYIMEARCSSFFLRVLSCFLHWTTWNYIMSRGKAFGLFYFIFIGNSQIPWQRVRSLMLYRFLTVGEVDIGSEESWSVYYSD